MTMPSNDSLVILLHGVGSRGADIGGLSDMWRASMHTTAFAAPDAPFSSSFGSGYQWFSVAGVTEENRPSRIAEARDAFDATIKDILEARGFSDRLDRVAFVGFSQGTIMALDAIVSGRWPVAGVLGYSGRLASPEPLTPSPGVHVLLIHGNADNVIPSDETPKAASKVRALGLPVTTNILPGVGHTITGEGARLGVEFLVGLFKH